MTKKIYLLSIFLLFTSCNHGENENESNKQDSIREIVKELKSGVSKKEKIDKELDSNLSMKNNNKNTQKTILQEMGIEFYDEKLIIDINKTDNFFSTLEKRIERHANKFEQNIESKIEKIDDINITHEMGVDIDTKEIRIDLNKTKNMLDNISHLFESILFESNSSKF